MSGVGAMMRVPAATRVAAMMRVPVFDAHRCKQCGLCTHLCPVGILELPARSAPSLPEPQACTGCRTCEFICPDFAVSMAELPPAAGNPLPAAGEHPSLGTEAETVDAGV
jgi:MinD superfamily P-loop ATPase